MNKDEINQETLDSCPTVELSNKHSERNDEIYNAVFELCQVLSESSELEWNMSFIGEIADTAAAIMVDHGIPVRFPSIVTEKDGSQHIEEYVNNFNPKEEPRPF